MDLSPPSTSMAHTISLLAQMNRWRRQLGVSSWVELMMSLLTVYLIFMYVVSWLGIYASVTPLLGILGMMFATYHIHVLGSLTERLEEFDRQNKKLSETNKSLEESVATFQEQNAKLKTITGTFG